MFKTYEGELVLSGFTVNGNMPMSTEKFYFSVDNDVIGERMKQFEGKKVVVMYKQKKGTLPWRGDSPYIVDSVRLVDQ